jgi:hypothetical protein
MSRGLGKHQQRILAVLEVLRDVQVADLCRELFGGTFSAVQYANTSAALRSLEARGTVQLYQAVVPDPWWHSKSRIYPAARLPSAEPHRYVVARASAPAEESPTSA